jgi:hypothetical protein
MAGSGSASRIQGVRIPNSGHPRVGIKTGSLEVELWSICGFLERGKGSAT